MGGPAHGRLRPAAAGQPARRRSSPPLAAATRPRQAPQPLPGPARLSPTPRETRHAHRLAETLPARLRTPEGSKNRPKAKRPPYRATDKPDKTGQEEITRAA